MGWYRKKPVVIEATQWFKNGDHPQDETVVGFNGRTMEPMVSEGKVVKRYPHGDAYREPCKHCKNSLHDHGWVDTLEGGHIVCPGDFIITGVQGEKYPCKPDIFEDTYEPVE